MRLLLDLGNTRLKWAIAASDGALTPMQALTHSADTTCWQVLIDDLADKRVEHIALSSVAGARTQALRQILRRRFANLAILEAASQASCAGVLNGYDAPETLGVDRFLALLGAFDTAAPTQIIAMLGTAMTIDVLHACGKHEGGLIVPGPSLMQSSLHLGTANLPLIAGRAGGLGRKTADAIYSGCNRACAALIEAVLNDFPSASLLLSGGAAEQVAPLLRYPVRIVPNLVLLGLQRFAHAAESGR